MKKPERLHLFEKPAGSFSKMENRPESRPEYHTARWTKESRAFRQRNPLCRMCRERGIIRAATVTDHIIPVEVHGDFWDQSNWQPLCTKHNIEKGNKDKKLIQKFRDEQRKTNQNVGN
jgi:5-methylcytosine-specific restriction endonuclease McrA